MKAKKPFLIEVCGMRDAENIRQLEALDIDMMGFDFRPDSPRYVQMISSLAGIIPDYSMDRYRKQAGKTAGQPEFRRIKRVGVFADDMPQNIITRIYNYELDYVQLQGEESPLMIDNLRRTVDPDIRAGIKIIKRIKVSSVSDFGQCKAYEGHADLLLFDMRREKTKDKETLFDGSLLQAYHGEIPFLLGGDIGPDDVDRLRMFNHLKCVGINVNKRFEVAPAVKDIVLLKTFVSRVNAGR